MSNLTEKDLNGNERIAFTRNAYEGRIQLCGPLYTEIRIGDGWFPVIVYTASEIEQIVERALSGMLTIAELEIPLTQSEISRPLNEGSITGKIVRTSMGERIRFIRQFGLDRGEQTQSLPLDLLLNPAKASNTSWLNIQGQKCGPDGELFSIDNLGCFNPIRNLGDLCNYDIKPLPSLTEIDAKTPFLICPEYRKTIEGLSQKIVLSNGQSLPVIPEFKRGNVEAYLEEKTQEAGLQLSIGIFAIERYLSGDFRKSPHYYKFNYSKYGRFFTCKGKLVELFYERQSGPIWIALTDEKSNGDGLESDSLFYNKEKRVYKINIPSIGDVFQYPSSGGEKGACELFFAMQGDECIAMGRNSPAISKSATGYEQSQHRDLPTIFRRIDEVLKLKN